MKLDGASQRLRPRPSAFGGPVRLCRVAPTWPKSDVAVGGMVPPALNSGNGVDRRRAVSRATTRSATFALKGNSLARHDLSSGTAPMRSGIKLPCAHRMVWPDGYGETATEPSLGRTGCPQTPLRRRRREAAL